MTTIKLAVLRHTKAKDGTYKIRISIGHKSETHYIVTKYSVTSLSHFQNGQVIGQPDAAAINIKLRQILTDYDQRLERVANMLKATDKTITQISEECGFSTPNYLIGTFYHQYKMTPGEYRENH